MKITITIPDEVYAKLESDRGSVPRSRYLQDLIMGAGGRSIGPGIFKGLEGLNTQVMVKENRVDIINGVGTIPSTNNKEIEDTNYGGVISAIERINDPEYQSDSEEIGEIRRMVREAGLSYNEKSKALWRQDGEKWKLIKQF